MYDLTVEGEHEFFANGLLVHNCLRYGVMQRPLKAPRLVKPETETTKMRMARAPLKRLHAPRRKKANSGFGPGQWA